jgi:hypothetical protein
MERLSRSWLGGVLMMTGCSVAPSPETISPVTRLAPAAFLEIPAAVRQTLTAQGCQIPQVSGTPEPHNLIRGEFAQVGQQDWVALCAREGRVSLYFVWGGPVRCPNDLELSAETNFLVRDPQGKLVFGTRLGVIDPTAITSLNQRNSSIIPLPISHLGIRQELVGTSTLIQYCDTGKWFRLQEPQRKLSEDKS